MKIKRWTALGLAVAGVVATAVFWSDLNSEVGKLRANVLSAPLPAPERGPRVELVAKNPLRLRVPLEYFASNRFDVAPLVSAPPPSPLRLTGSIILDPNRHAKIHSLFSGQVVKFGLPGDTSKKSVDLSDTPEKGLRPGDSVTKGQILCTIWSKDVGAMKTDLVNQMSQLRSVKKVLDRFNSVEEGAIAKNLVTQARQQYENATVLVRNAERNLRSSQFSEEEIAVVRAEGEKLQEPDAPRDLELERTWAEYPIRAPFDGVLVENNIHIGAIVDPTADLFKLAKMDRLQILATIYEEDLPKLQRLIKMSEQSLSNRNSGAASLYGPGDPQSWRITRQSDETGAEEIGRFEKLGPIIDPMQHSGTVTGWIENPNRTLVIGQFVTVAVNLLPDPSLVAVPASAVVEDADGSTVFVAADASDRQFTPRRVSVAVRGRDSIFLRKEPKPTEAARGIEGFAGAERILSKGAVELAGEISAVLAEQPPQK